MLPDSSGLDGTAGNESSAERLLRDGAFTVYEAVVFSGLSRTALFEFISRGELPSLKIGKRRLVPRRALIKMLADRMEGS